MTLNQIQNKAHAGLEILTSFLFYCRQASSQTYLFKLRTAACTKLTNNSFSWITPVHLTLLFHSSLALESQPRVLPQGLTLGFQPKAPPKGSWSHIPYQGPGSNFSGMPFINRNLIQKHEKNNEFYETFLIYSIKLSGPSYKIKS